MTNELLSVPSMFQKPHIKGPAAYNQEIHFQKINGEKKDISKNKGKGREVIEVLFSHTLSVKIAKFSHFLWHL